MNIAKTWSGGKVESWSSETPTRRPANDGISVPTPGSSIQPRQQELDLRPEIIKRDTSNQCETLETKSSVKRAALNRDNSLASNRLKQEYLPEYYNAKFNSDVEVKSLSTNLELSSLDPKSTSEENLKPKSLGADDRVSTVDAITMALMAKPEPLLTGDRISTIDALDLDLETDETPVLEQTRETSNVKVEPLPKPSGLSGEDRLTTQDFMDLLK